MKQYKLPEEKRNTIFKVRTIRLIHDFSREIMEPRRQHNGMFIVLNEEKERKKSPLKFYAFKVSIQMNIESIRCKWRDIVTN